MRLVVKRDGHTVNKFQFDNGPIHIGRHADSQIFLPDRIISRHHAVIFRTPDGKWMAEDLDSTNRTYLNDSEIHKAEIKTGDCLRIADFTIEINLEAGAEAKKAINLEDTLTKTAYDLEDTSIRGPLEPQVIVRRPDAEHAPEMRLPLKRARDFMQATEAICRANALDEVLKVLLQITAKQFSSYQTWCALRNEPSGPMSSYSGRKRDGSAVILDEIELKDKVNEAVERNRFLLLPRIPPPPQGKQIINSAMIAPIMGQTGCFGVLYIDNDTSHEHYSLSDLDYLMLLAIHTAVIVENF